MNIISRILFSCLAVCISAELISAAGSRHLLYVASPGIRNYLEYGGIGILVFDVDDGYKFVRRIPTWTAPEGKKVENVKGIAASAKTGTVYVTSLDSMIAIDAVTGKTLWSKIYTGGCDRMAISPDGTVLYVPELEGPGWHVVNAATGDVVTTIDTNSGSHNTIWSVDGSYVYLAGLKSRLLSIADANTNRVVRTVGPFENVIRPFTVNGRGSLVFVNVNGLLGFEIGDLRTGRKLYHVEVEGYKQGPVKRHGCPSHGIALTPDERELWLADCANDAIHVFDSTIMPPKQLTTIKARDCVGWVSFSMDGKIAYSSTGEIIDVATKKVIASLRDENGHDVQSEKVLDLVIEDGKGVRAGIQFGVGKQRKNLPSTRTSLKSTTSFQVAGTE
jgi:DNA-binding beta-propeller fold protein YncE